MSPIFVPEEKVRLPEDVPGLGLKRGTVGRVIYVYPNKPHMADVEFPRENGKYAIGILTKDPELYAVDFYP